MTDKQARDRDLKINEDMLSVDRELGPLTPELRSAIRWVAYRAVARELEEGSRARAAELRAKEDAEQAFVLKQTSGDTP